ncbi:MAG: ribbon-helix-helix domain-containing protein [Deinococcota bacterium]|nr:ribbon-helix-helix domain-containing protein [Deinococcota bacterium]
MKRTTVYLEEGMDLDLACLAKQQERSKAELIREALEQYLKTQEKPRRLPRSVGIGRSGMPDLAERSEELYGKFLEEEFEEIMADWQERQNEPRP